MEHIHAQSAALAAGHPNNTSIQETHLHTSTPIKRKWKSHDQSPESTFNFYEHPEDLDETLGASDSDLDSSHPISDEEPDAHKDEGQCSPAEMHKLLVFENNLSQLFRGSHSFDNTVIIHAESSTKGSMLICKTMCSSGCICMWSSQTVVQSMPLGNLLLAGESKEKL